MSKCCPLVSCRLTDRFGRVLNPYRPGSILYTVLSAPARKKLSVAIEGYTAVYADEKRISPPIPFCMIEETGIPVSRGEALTFRVKDFRCCAVPRQSGQPPGLEQTRLLIEIETAVILKKAMSLLVPQVDSNLREIGSVCLYTNRLQSIRLQSGCCIAYESAALKAETYQFCALADGVKRTYNSGEEWWECGCREIPSPENVSYYDVFVNGVLQPKTNYILKQGELTFTTQDVPSERQPIMVLFTTWKDYQGRRMNTTVRQYNAVSDGVKKVYTDGDEIPEYGLHGIPSPSEVSFFNLYSNGVLQPQTNYRVSKGVLELVTADAPTKGSPVILESVVIQNPLYYLFHIEVRAFNAYSNGGRIYTNQDEIEMYGTDGIPSPGETLYQNLFINAVVQPHANYRVREGRLILETTDIPTVGAPVTLQYVKRTFPEPCNTKLSDAAFAQWKKEYPHSGSSCFPASPLTVQEPNQD